MERDCDSCLFTIVDKTKFKLLLATGRYERRNRGILVGKEKLADGREDFAILDSEWARYEKVEREVMSEVERVADIDIPIEIIDPTVAQSPAPSDGIPSGDKAAAFKVGLGEGQPLPNHPESSRPRDRRGGFDPFGGR